MDRRARGVVAVLLLVATGLASAWSTSPASASALAVTASHLTVTSSSVTVPKSTVAVGQSASGGTAGAPHTTTVTLAGGTPGATGTLSVMLFPGATCTGTAVAPGAQTIVVAGAAGQSYPAASRTPPTAGAYSWLASYSGDGDNDPASSCVAITVTAPAPATVTITQVAAGGAVTTPRTTTATLAGGTAGATGTLTVVLYGPGTGCSGTVVGPSQTIPVAGAAGQSYTSAARTPLTAGTYWWSVSYSGDAGNSSATSCTSITVSKATVSISQVAAGGAPGTAHSTTATLSGGTAGAGGTLTVTLYPGGSCTGTPVSPGAQSTTVSGAAGQSYASANRTPPTAGTYSWLASYGGDANNLAATSCKVITVAASTVLHVSAITVISTVNQNANFWNATIQVEVRDANDILVGTVVVTGAWSPTALAADRSTCTTSATGTCNIASGTGANGFSSGNPTQTWTVSNLARAGYTYNAAANVVSSVTVTKP